MMHVDQSHDVENVQRYMVCCQRNNGKNSPQVVSKECFIHGIKSPFLGNFILGDCFIYLFIYYYYYLDQTYDRSIFKAVVIEHFSTQFFCINMLLRARESLDLNL